MLEYYDPWNIVNGKSTIPDPSTDSKPISNWIALDNNAYVFLDQNMEPDLTLQLPTCDTSAEL
jgi:hypothetical protein